MLDQAFQGGQGFGTASGPGEAAVRNLMRQGLAAGLGNGQVNNFLNPGFYRGTNDPNGGGSLFRNLDAGTLTQLAHYAGQQTGSGLVHGGSTDAQANFFAAFPQLQQQYMAQANSYVNPTSVDSVNPNTTPPNAQLGSDGRYHDPSMPLPPGVTLTGPQPTGWTPPEGQGTGTLPQVGNPATGQGQPAPNGPTRPGAGGPGQQAPVSTNPMTAAAAGRDPTKHLAFWHSKGWNYNPATGAWAQTGPGSGPGTPGPGGMPNHVPAGTTPGTMPGLPSSGNPGTGSPVQLPSGAYGGSQSVVPGQSTGLPLDPVFEAAQRAADYNLSQALGQTNAASADVAAQQQLALARMGTDSSQNVQQLMNSLAGRGTLQSSQYGQGLTDLATSDLRSRQDLANQTAVSQGQIAAAASGAYGDYAQAIANAMLAEAQRQSTSQYAPTPSAPTRRPARPARRRR